jgi:hypothetical protein
MSEPNAERVQIGTGPRDNPGVAPGAGWRVAARTGNRMDKSAVQKASRDVCRRVRAVPRELAEQAVAVVRVRFSTVSGRSPRTESSGRSTTTRDTWAKSTAGIAAIPEQP